MTTTTRESISTELGKLHKASEEAREEYNEAKARRESWDMEDAPEIRPGTLQAELHAERREQEHGENPHRQQHEAAKATYEELDARLKELKRECVRDRIEDVPVDHAIETMLNGFKLLVKGCESYADAVSAVRDIVIDTDGLDGQAYTLDPRPAEWLRLALGTLDGEIAKPRLTPQAEAKLDG